jgi:hypothetical protein
MFHLSTFHILMQPSFLLLKHHQKFIIRFCTFNIDSPLILLFNNCYSEETWGVPVSILCTYMPHHYKNLKVFEWLQNTCWIWKLIQMNTSIMLPKTLYNAWKLVTDFTFKNFLNTLNHASKNVLKCLKTCHKLHI